ncbi:MAG: hypothetical protein Q4A00_05670 [Flavobacteriaceae bacterium]|nr:hypothetical protein [Flavobacteriaceae bacterium]
MISITEPLIDITMKIEMDLPQTEILEFLNQKGYKTESFRYEIPATEEMLISEPCIVQHTFTATKNGELQSKDTLYLKVFEREMQAYLKEFLNS